MYELCGARSQVINRAVWTVFARLMRSTDLAPTCTYRLDGSKGTVVPASVSFLERATLTLIPPAFTLNLVKSVLHMFLVLFELRPLCWCPERVSCEWTILCMSSSRGIPGIPAEFHLIQMKSLLIFTTMCYRHSSSWHWCTGLESLEWG